MIEAASADLPLTLDVGGRLAAFRTADVRARVPGVLQERVYTEGSDVREGEVLFLIDPAPLQVIHAPGHAADHHVVFDPETGTLFSSDLWLGVKVRVLGEEENPYEIVRSLERAIALQPVRMFDAHRGLVERPVDALRAKRHWMQETIGAIES